MPTEAEFEALSKEHGGNVLATSRHSEIVKERWPKKEDSDAFYAWAKDQIDKRRTELLKPMEPSEFIDLVSTMNLTNEKDVRMLMGAMWPSVPYIPIGFDENICYRLLPREYGLRPDRIISSAKGDILDDHILGVNTNVQPRYPERPAWRCKLGLPEMSSDSNEFDWKGGGFVFHQLGTLEFREDVLEDLQSWKLSYGEIWCPSGYCVVIRFNSNGVSEGIYIITSFYPVYDDEEHAETKIIELGWGYLPTSRWTDKRCFMGKIADNIQELGFDRKLNITEVIEYPVEIVPAMRTPAGTIVRTTVSRN